MDAILSLHAACAVLDAYDFGENTFIAILRTLKARGLIRDDGVLQSALNKVIDEFKI